MVFLLLPLYHILLTLSDLYGSFNYSPFSGILQVFYHFITYRSMIWISLKCTMHWFLFTLQGVVWHNMCGINHLSNCWYSKHTIQFCGALWTSFFYPYLPVVLYFTNAGMFYIAKSKGAFPCRWFQGDGLLVVGPWVMLKLSKTLQIPEVFQCRQVVSDLLGMGMAGQRLKVFSATHRSITYGSITLKVSTWKGSLHLD